MNNLRLLIGVMLSTLLSSGVHAYGQRVITLEEIFKTADNESVQLRPFFSAQDEARREIDVAKSERLPDIEASLSVSYIGDGFTT
ncbi:MAG: TolC family protein, partial [Muribaculaceae bacterium]|nr:TolC family protein [Muribaculaceae bacterium]